MVDTSRDNVEAREKMMNSAEKMRATSQYGHKMMNAQEAAEAYWTIANSTNLSLANPQSPIYVAAKKLVIDAIVKEHGVSRNVATRVYNHLSLYGPNGTFEGTYGHYGITSYVIYVLKNPK